MAAFTFMLINVVIFLCLFFTVSLAIADSISFSESISDGTTLVSKGGTFELGFFSPGSSSNKNRYLGIWYNKNIIQVQTVVWVANRCKPINDSSGLLALNDTGSLVLFGQNKSVVWWTNSTKQPWKPMVQLLDSGNLVVREENDTNPGNYLWQSFDYPSDTMLPGMKFGWDLRRSLNRRLSAWQSSDDPCPGDLTYGIEFEEQNKAFPNAVLRKEAIEFYRTGPWNGVGYSGCPFLRPNSLYDFYFVNNDDEVSYIYNLKNNSVISIIVINQTTGTWERSTWVESNKRWEPYYTLPTDHCDSYYVCGVNGNCVIGDSPICHCLKRFKPKSQEKWSQMEWSEGCERNTPLSCHEKETDGFVKYSGLKLPDTTNSWVNQNMSIKECRAKCLSNCSCMAYTNSDIRGQGSGCALWFGDLIDIRQFPSPGGQDLYIRMPYSELEKANKVKRAILIVVALITVSAMLLFGYCIYRRGELRGSSETDNGGQEEDLGLPLFNLSILTTATENFSVNNMLGEGGFGPVYRGTLEDGQEIAVKRLSFSSRQGVNEFKNEVKLIAKLQHRNLVKLVGCCIEREEKLLVYEYMPNKSLDFFIFDQKQRRILDWSKLFQIICGIARGLLYLHQDSRLRIIHRDLKASNVLLDNEMNPKISDFGLARIVGGDQIEEQTERIMGTYGYMAPEYASEGLFSIKSDVFSFGMLVLELLNGNRNKGFHLKSHGQTLTKHAWSLFKEGKSFEFLDKCLIFSDEDLHGALRCIHIGLLCVQQNPIDRLNMSSIIMMLGSEIELPQPKLPGYFLEIYAAKGDKYDSLAKPASSATNDMSITLLEAR